MSYLGRRGASAALTSADIPDDSITAAKIVDGAVDFQNELGFLENKATTQNLTGTYSTERMYLNDSYTLTGDVTVTGHLALGSIADEDIVITQDGTERTITGSGTLESGNVLQDTHRTSLTDMTGELGSVVTGSPNLNLGNATFPAGHVIDFQTTSFPSAQDQTATTATTHYSNDTLTISNVPAGGKLVAQFWGGFSEHSAGYGNTWGFQINGTDFVTNYDYDSRVPLPASKSVAFASSTDNVVVKLVITRTGGSYMEYQLGGSAPAEMMVFVIV